MTRRCTCSSAGRMAKPTRFRVHPVALGEAVGDDGRGGCLREQRKGRVELLIEQGVVVDLVVEDIGLSVHDPVDLAQLVGRDDVADGVARRVDHHQRRSLGGERTSERVHVDAFGRDVDVVELDGRARQHRAVEVERVIRTGDQDLEVRPASSWKILRKMGEVPVFTITFAADTSAPWRPL